MNLFDRLRYSMRSFAASSAPTGSRRQPPREAEVGVSGDYRALYNNWEFRQDDISIKDYRKMLDNDGTVEAVYNMLTMPIKGASYHFEVEKGGDAELQLVQDNFTLPPHKGGMTLPFELLIADMLRALAEGFRLYEKVWTVQDGKFVYRKLAPRDSDTIFLERDDHGGFAGAHQRVFNGTTFQFVDVDIPIERCFLFTYAKERSFLYGRSALKSAHYHYDRKHKLYLLEQLGAQSAAVPPRKLTVPESIYNNAEKLAQAEAAADALGGISQTISLPDGFDVNEYKTNPMPLDAPIAHHDTLIARSILAQFLVLAGHSKGSYALSQTDTENFIMALQGTMKQIEHHINAFLIPDLIDFNFGSGRYPEFKFEDIGSDTKDILKNAFTAILSRQDMPGYVIEGIAAQVATELGIEVGNTAPLAGATPAAPTTDPTTKTKNQAEHSGGTIHLAEGGYFRQLTDAEKRVNLSELSKKTTSAEEQLQAAAQTFYDGLKADALKRLTALLNKGDYASLKSFELGSFTPYRKALEAAMMAQYLYGKRTAADEVGGKMPQTPSKSRLYVTQTAQAVADKQASDLTFAVKNAVTTELRKQNLSDKRDLGIADIMARIAMTFLGFQDSSVAKGIALSLAGSLNLGRGDSFGASEDIDRMQYSAILDNRTSEMCRDLDGSVVSYEEFRATKWIPPCHFNCRSIWVAILKDDDFKPDFKDLPAAPGGFQEPQI